MTENNQSYVSQFRKYITDTVYSSIANSFRLASANLWPNPNQPISESEKQELDGSECSSSSSYSDDDDYNDSDYDEELNCADEARINFEIEKEMFKEIIQKKVYDEMTRGLSLSFLRNNNIGQPQQEQIRQQQQRQLDEIKRQRMRIRKNIKRIEKEKRRNEKRKEKRERRELKREQKRLRRLNIHHQEPPSRVIDNDFDDEPLNFVPPVMPGPPFFENDEYNLLDDNEENEEMKDCFYPPPESNYSPYFSPPSPPADEENPYSYQNYYANQLNPQQALYPNESPYELNIPLFCPPPEST